MARLITVVRDALERVAMGSDLVGTDGGACARRVFSPTGEAGAAGGGCDDPSGADATTSKVSSPIKVRQHNPSAVVSHRAFRCGAFFGGSSISIKNGANGKWVNSGGCNQAIKLEKSEWIAGEWFFLLRKLQSNESGSGIDEVGGGDSVFDATMGNGNRNKLGIYLGVLELAPVFKHETLKAAEVFGVVRDDGPLIEQAAGGDEDIGDADGGSLIESSGVEAGCDAGAGGIKGQNLQGCDEASDFSVFFRAMCFWGAIRALE